MADAKTVITNEAIYSKLVDMDSRLINVETKLTSVETKQTSMEDRQTIMESRLAGMESWQTGIDAKHTGMDAKLDKLHEDVLSLTLKVDSNHKAAIAQVDDLAALIQNNFYDKGEIDNKFSYHLHTFHKNEL